MSKKKKVLILGKLPPPYMGPSVAFEILINSDLKNYYQLLSLDTKANASLDTLGKWSFRKLLDNFRIYYRLFVLLNKEKPNLALIPVSQATIGFIKDSVFILLCKLTGTRCLIQLRGSDFKRWISNAPGYIRVYVKFILSLTKGVLVLGNNLKYIFKDYFTTSQIYVVPNGGNYSISKVPSRDEIIRIIYLANLQESKGIEDVLQAMILVEYNLPGISSLVVIGAWRKQSTKENCLRLVAENNLPVSFLSPEMSKNKFDHLAASDVFVFTPREPEGHPWVIVEAMASSLPVISTNQGAITESVIEGENGFIVPVRDPQAIADRIIKLIKDATLRKKMGERSRQLYLEKFTEDKMVENYIRTFDSVLNS